MKRTPEKGRGTTGQGRPIGPTQGNRVLWEAGSVTGLSSAIAISVTLPAIPAMRAFYLRFSAVSYSRDSNCRWLPAVVTTGRFSRYRERALTVPAISSISSWCSQSTSGRGGHFPSGRGCHQYPNGATECRMGESPAGGGSPLPGTQRPKGASSFRRGRERSEVPVREHRTAGGVSA
jgi:hypothetical protein